MVIGERYQVEAPLGRGGAAQLYRVVELARGRTLALKLLHASVHAQLRELFELEYQTLASLDHPRTPRVFEFGSDPRGVFYTMELLEGCDLSSLAPLSWRTVCDHIRDASQALGLLHARSLIHRDVSPRNLWRTPDGRVKLIDFGALAPFGPNAQIIGTPPLVPPEALAARALDQRADLYSLGGVAYFLLTGRQAFPARKLESLYELWREPPAAPSQYVAQLARADLEPVPPELDALVLALLNGNELVRPSSTAEVIDRIDALRGATSDSEREAALARLTNVACVGRVRERRRLARRFSLATHGRGQACVIEAAPGGGRTRALKELELEARVAHADVVYANAAAEGASYGVANALALGLLDAVPELARSAARPHAPLLAHLSVRMRDRLETAAAPMPEVAGEARVKIQEAERDWFLSIARERPLVLLVDGLELADDGSVAFLLSLALSLRRSKLLLVATLTDARVSERSAAVRALLKASHVVSLSPLQAADMRALLHSAFGAAEHLARLSGRLFELTGGNPGHALELCRQLVERGAISFESGSWILPRELDLRGLSQSREQALVDRLSRVEGPPRVLACLLSVHAGPLTPGLCRALATSGGQDLLPHLGELIAAAIIVPSGQSLLFAHELIREACGRELPSEAGLSARRALAEQLVSAPEAGALERLQAGVHWTVAGDPRGPRLVVHETLQVMYHELDRLVAAAPTLEAALLAFRANHCSPYEEAALLTALALAGYEGDQRYILQYGEAAVRTLETLLGLDQARKWSPLLGGKLGLLAGLGYAALRVLVRRHNPCVPRFADLTVMMFTAVTCSAGASSIGFDPDAASRLAEVLQPFAALGPNHPAGLMYEFCQAIAETTRDRQYRTHLHWRDLLVRLETNQKLRRRVPENHLRRCRGGALFGLAAIEMLKDSDDCLRTAELLDANGFQLDRVCADQIRTIYYGVRGDVAAYEHYRQRAEHHAIARGTTWQVESWIPGPASLISLQLHDALGMKSSSEQMLRLSKQRPAMEVHARHMRGVYLLLRGKPAEALLWLADCLQEPPWCRIAWARSHGVLARAYNRLGDHAQAHAACMRVFDLATDDDFELVHVNLVVQTELVVAEAGIGRVSEARQRLERLHARHEKSGNPLLRGQLFEAGLEVALIVSDLAAARHQLAYIESLYLPLSIPSLAQYCEAMAARIDQLAGVARGGPVRRGALQPKTANNTGSDLSWSTDRMRTGENLPMAERAQRALRLIATSTQASEARLYLADGGATPKLLANLSGQAPSALLQAWIAERIASPLEEEVTLLETDLATTQNPSNLLREADLTHRLLTLTAADGALIALAFVTRAGEAPLTCSSALLRALADRLHEAQDEQKTKRASVLSRGRSR